MPARKNTPKLREAWRKKIQATMLLNRLQDHVEGKLDMTPTQIQAAKIVLAKTIPDLKAVEHSGEDRHVNVTVKTFSG